MFGVRRPVAAFNAIGRRLKMLRRTRCASLGESLISWGGGRKVCGYSNRRRDRPLRAFERPRYRRSPCVIGLVATAMRLARTAGATVSSVRLRMLSEPVLTLVAADSLHSTLSSNSSGSESGPAIRVRHVHVIYSTEVLRR